MLLQQGISNQVKHAAQIEAKKSRYWQRRQAGQCVYQGNSFVIIAISHTKTMASNGNTKPSRNVAAIFAFIVSPVLPAKQQQR